MTTDYKREIEEIILAAQMKAIAGPVENQSIYDARDKLMALLQQSNKENIEQHMVYLFRQLPLWIVTHNSMSKARTDSLWSNMCMWTDEYLKQLTHTEEDNE